MERPTVLSLVHRGKRYRGTETAIPPMMQRDQSFGNVTSSGDVSAALDLLPPFYSISSGDESGRARLTV